MGEGRGVDQEFINQAIARGDEYTSQQQQKLEEQQQKLEEQQQKLEEQQQAVLAEGRELKKRELELQNKKRELKMYEAIDSDWQKIKKEERDRNRMLSAVRGFQEGVKNQFRDLKREVAKGLRAFNTVGHSVWDVAQDALDGDVCAGERIVLRDRTLYAENDLQNRGLGELNMSGDLGRVIASMGNWKIQHPAIKKIKQEENGMTMYDWGFEDPAIQADKAESDWKVVQEMEQIVETKIQAKVDEMKQGARELTRWESIKQGNMLGGKMWVIELDGQEKALTDKELRQIATIQLSEMEAVKENLNAQSILSSVKKLRFFGLATAGMAVISARKDHIGVKGEDGSVLLQEKGDLKRLQQELVKKEIENDITNVKKKQALHFAIATLRRDGFTEEQISEKLKQHDSDSQSSDDIRRYTDGALADLEEQLRFNHEEKGAYDKRVDEALQASGIPTTIERAAKVGQKTGKITAQIALRQADLAVVASGYEQFIDMLDEQLEASGLGGDRDRLREKIFESFEKIFYGASEEAAETMPASGGDVGASDGAAETDLSIGAEGGGSLSQLEPQSEQISEAVVEAARERALEGHQQTIQKINESSVSIDTYLTGDEAAINYIDQTKEGGAAPWNGLSVTNN